MITPIDITIQGDKPFIDEAELAIMLRRTPKQVRRMARKGTIARPLEQAPKGPWVWRVMDLHTFKAPIKTICAEVANDTTSALDPETGNISGDFAIQQAAQRRAPQSGQAANA